MNCDLFPEYGGATSKEVCMDPMDASMQQSNTHKKLIINHSLNAGSPKSSSKQVTATREPKYRTDASATDNGYFIYISIRIKYSLEYLAIISLNLWIILVF